VNADASAVARIRTAYLKHAVHWVCELAARDRLEARDLAVELRGYFQSVSYSLPSKERRDLSSQIEEICGSLSDFQTPEPVMKVGRVPGIFTPTEIKKTVR
jgi:hypothetical protein